VWIQDRYRELLRTGRIWMDVELRLRSGQAHRPDDVKGAGSLVLPCVTCPTERNRQKGWEEDDRT
jgi:hypothetical protein